MYSGDVAGKWGGGMDIGAGEGRSGRGAGGLFSGSFSPLGFRRRLVVRPGVGLPAWTDRGRGDRGSDKRDEMRPGVDTFLVLSHLCYRERWGKMCPIRTWRYAPSSHFLYVPPLPHPHPSTPNPTPVPQPHPYPPTPSPRFPFRDTNLC